MLRRLTAWCTGILEWFADAGRSPRTRIELNHNEAMKSLLAAGSARLDGAQWVGAVWKTTSPLGTCTTRISWRVGSARLLTATATASERSL